MSRFPLTTALSSCLCGLLLATAASAAPLATQAVLKLKNATGQRADDIHFEMTGARFTGAKGLTPGVKEIGNLAGTKAAAFDNFNAGAGKDDPPISIHVDFVIESNINLDLTYFWTRSGQPILYDKPGSKTQYFRVPRLMIDTSGNLDSGLSWQHQNHTPDDDFALTELGYATVSRLFDIDLDTPINVTSVIDQSLLPGDSTGLLFSPVNRHTEALYLTGRATSALGSQIDFRYLVAQVPEPGSLSLVCWALCLLVLTNRPRRTAVSPPPLLLSSSCC